MSNVYDDVAAMLADSAKTKVTSGSFPMWMPLEGCVALMCDKLQRWLVSKDDQELENMAVDAFLLLMLLLKKQGINNG